MPHIIPLLQVLVPRALIPVPFVLFDTGTHLFIFRVFLTHLFVMALPKGTLVLFVVPSGIESTTTTDFVCLPIVVSFTFDTCVRWSTRIFQLMEWNARSSNLSEFYFTIDVVKVFVENMHQCFDS